MKEKVEQNRISSKKYLSTLAGSCCAADAKPPKRHVASNSELSMGSVLYTAENVVGSKRLPSTTAPVGFYGTDVSCME